MTPEEFSRLLMAALREPKIEAAVLRIINEHTAKARRKMVAREIERARGAPQGALERKGAIRAVTPLNKPK